MSDEDIWRHDSLGVDDRGFVTGSAYTETVHGHTVQVGVFSYEYRDDGEVKMNHVPNVVLTDETGNIVSEPHAHDSAGPQKAIENARSMGEYTAEHVEQYVD